MKKLIIIIIVLVNFTSLNLLGQLILRSDFLNMKLTPKNSSNEVISPSYTITYIYIGVNEDDIGIHIFDTDNYNTPIMLNDFKIVNEPLKDKKTVYYTREGHFLNWDHDKKIINWVYEDDILKYNWSFEGLALTNETEYNNYLNSFNIEDPKTNANFSNNSHNLLGYNIEAIRYKYSQGFEEPLDITHEIEIKNTPVNLVLQFETKNDRKTKHLFSFDKNGICIIIMQIYPIEFLKDILEVYNSSYGFQSNKTWIEKSYDKSYIYEILDNNKKLFVLSITENK